MASSNTQSLSKGVFAFRGKKRKPEADDFVSNTSDIKSLQLEHYSKLINEFEQISKSIHSDVANDLFTELISYIDSCGQKKLSDEIHAAAIVTGVNTPDHDVLYDNIVTHVKAKVTPYVAAVRHKASSTALRHIMSSLSSQLNECCDRSDVESLPSTLCTFSHIVRWYKDMETDPPSPRKKGKRTSSEQPHKRRPLVFIFEEFSSFPMSAMQDFLISCRNHLESIPIVLVFGVSLSLTSLRSTLTHEVSTMLSIEAFQMTSSSVYLSTIIQKMLIESELPFRLSGKTFQLLLDNFLCHDFSIQRFLHTIEFCVMDHCLGNEASISSISRCKKLPKVDLDNIRRLMSFRKYVEEELDADRQINLLTDDSYTKQAVLTLISNVETYHRIQPYLLTCLHHLVKDLPGSIFGRQVREVYFTVLSDGLQDKLREAFSVLGTLSRPELEQQLSFTLQTLASCPGDVDTTALKSAHDRLCRFDELLEAAEAEASSSPDKKSLLSGKKMDMYTLRKTLQEQRPAHLTLYDDMRRQSLEALIQLYTEHLIYYKDLPLYEFFYYDDIKALRAAVNAMPRVAVFSALSKPHVYLDRAPQLSTDQNVASTLPDTSLAFKLHQECGAMINMYDWMQAFISVHENSKFTDHDTKQLCARFTHSAAEMQLLGFIKSTKRKTDHVSRLTWGTV